MRTMKNAVQWKMNILKTVKWKKTCFQKCKTVQPAPIAPLIIVCNDSTVGMSVRHARLLVYNMKFYRSILTISIGYM